MNGVSARLRSLVKTILKQFGHALDMKLDMKATATWNRRSSSSGQIGMR